MAKHAQALARQAGRFGTILYTVSAVHDAVGPMDALEPGIADGAFAAPCSERRSQL